MQQLRGKNLLLVGFTLFSMFFGAGNLIFPPFLGAQAGTAAWVAMAGFAISAIGFPILGVIEVARSGGLQHLAERVHPRFAAVFTLLIYLSIGPGLAIPRTASTSFEMVAPFLGSGRWIQAVYSLVFFALSALVALRPEKLTTVQKKNLAVIGVALVWLLVPAMIQALAPNDVTAFLTKYCDTQMVSILGAIACGLMGLADERKILQHAVPWTTILAVCGISMLLGVASEAGALDMMAKLLGSSLSPRVIVAVFLLVGGFMSFFTGGVTVVTPMLLPIALSVAAERGINLTWVCSAAVLGALATGMSPFSTGGSLVVAGMPDERERERLVNRQFGITFLAWGVFLFFGVTGLFGILD